MAGDGSKREEKTDIWMPLYIGDYLSDTMRLTTEQHGAYLLLLMEHWMQGPIPDDDETLAAVTKLSIERWQKTRGLLLGYFSVSSGFWTHKRVVEEKAKAEAFKAKQRANGMKGGRPRKNPENPNETQTEANSKAKQNPNESPSPSPSQVLKDKKTLSSEDDGGLFNPPPKPKSAPIPYDAIFDAYEQTLCVEPYNRPRVKIRDDKRKNAIKRIVKLRPKAIEPEWWLGYFGVASEFEHWMNGSKLTGGTWDGANFDFLLRDDNFKKILEKYS